VPLVLTTNALTLCPHGGRGTSVPSDPKWSVNGGFVLVEDDVGALACPFVPYPCIGYRLQSMGLNATVIDGRKVILTSDFNQSFTGLPLTMVDFHHTIDDSSPTPVPAGGGTPHLPPQLTDMTAPTVVGIPPALAFDSTTTLPLTAVATFTLIGGYPMRWVLTLIDEPQQYHADITNGLPPNLRVAPAGGSWPASPLTVTVALAAPYMASLGVGKHHFFMTAVSQRGLSSFAEVELVVS
jgi:hypothetical protein